MTHSLRRGSGPTGKGLCLALLAVDQLKMYAGVHGKSAIEQILKLVAPKVQAACRAGRVFRVSGEELTLLFRHQSALDAVGELENIRKTVETTTLLFEGQRIWETSSRTASSARTHHPLPITASIGVADTSGEACPRSVVIKAAYRALYEATTAGGNAVKRRAASRSLQ